jgi:hypothetical protein
LTILRDGGSYLGGYLVTNAWGRPLEFRLSTAVQPNRVQQILYAGTLEGYVCADLIGKTLLDKTAAPVQFLLTDTRAVLDLRLRQPAPVLWLTPSEPLPEPGKGEHCVRPAAAGRLAVYCHGRFPEDAAPGQELLHRVDGVLDLAEPFVRIREAVAEARKLGVTKAA